MEEVKRNKEQIGITRSLFENIVVFYENINQMRNTIMPMIINTIQM
jgi:hypothetical protein